MEIISATPALENLCAELAHDGFIAVDTEFMREQTYWPILCLIQVAGSRRQAVIDPLSPGLDLASFYALMANERVIKVFHAARQDVEIIFVRAGTIPKPLFDTQVAAMVCGFGEQVSYEGLVRSLARAKIDKSSRFTDWSRRPLSDRQLAYAVSDVTHLRTIYVKLKAELDRSEREPWLQEEMTVLTSPETYRSDPVEAWRRIKFRARSRRQLAVLAGVTEWREREAQMRDVPRNRVLKDDVLVELAVQAPQSEAELKGLRALPRGFSGSRFAEPVLEAVAAALATPESDWPPLASTAAGRAEGTSPTVEVLRLALKIVCEAEGIAPRLVASTADLEAVAAGAREGVALLQGWRYAVFGRIALALARGDIAISLEAGRPRLTPVQPKALAAAE
jgi:ribonuclease D